MGQVGEARGVFLLQSSLGRLGNVSMLFDNVVTRGYVVKGTDLGPYLTMRFGLRYRRCRRRFRE